jgi:dTDP-4-dehydrorhamnose reductase
MELWTGVECTINRVKDTYFNQLTKNGHDCRLEDIDLLYNLGIRTLRYPFLWEQAAPERHGEYDWSWMDARLEKLRALGLNPIAGLLHHGSGPAYTSLIDGDFPEKFAAYAAAFAQRYPWVRDYTPINEPLTTARFSGLYGHWYPHGRDGRTFAAAVVNQMWATVRAMEEIRKVNPEARLIQTEDMGKIWSSPRVAYQANFENERRWLSFDLLCGRVDVGHRFWRYLLGHGVREEQLQAFRQKPCPPDVVGINYYVTSERFLDEDHARYPPYAFSSNGRHRYADIEAVRVDVPVSLGPILLETWERYGLPIAVTEAHLHCTREEQMRWLLDVWTTAQQVATAGVDLRAVTAWAAFGSYNWHTLLTRDEDHYESGLFDVRAPGRPRPTALAHMVRDLVRDGKFQHFALEQPGWWQRPERVHFRRTEELSTASAGFVARHAAFDALNPRTNGHTHRPVVITGASGTLGRAMARLCELRALDYRLLSRQECEITDRDSIERMFRELRPWAVINAAGYVRVDDAEHDAERCLRANADGPAWLAEGCARHDAKMLAFSSDLVFDGAKGRPYVESDAVNPLNVYGRSKAEMERRVLEANPDSLIVRTSAFFGPWDEYNFCAAVLRTLAQGEPFHAADDYAVSPTYVPDLGNHSLDLLLDGERGIWHLASTGVMTWAELARWVAVRAGYDADMIVGRPVASFDWPAGRPLYGVLASERGPGLMPKLEVALERWWDSARANRAVLQI